ncbi:hypothetical protein GCM10009609_17250 [Pseudonocardia aurantiaca]
MISMSQTVTHHGAELWRNAAPGGGDRWEKGAGQVGMIRRVVVRDLLVGLLLGESVPAAEPAGERDLLAAVAGPFVLLARLQVVGQPGIQPVAQ